MSLRHSRSSRRPSGGHRHPPSGDWPTHRSWQGPLGLERSRHGLGAIQALLPGEDAGLYEARANAFFTAHGVDNEAVAEIASLAFDDVWKLERLGKMETALLLSRVEELRCQTELAERAAATTQAILTLGAALDEWVAEPVPTRRCDELSKRITPCARP